jgi:hypothetical protein
MQGKDLNLDETPKQPKRHPNANQGKLEIQRIWTIGSQKNESSG